MHIDGILNAKQISQKAEVDMELVRACLRVLKHHDVIALVDMFYYTNRYECTENASLLLLPSQHNNSTGSNNRISNLLLEEAVRYVFRGNHENQQSNEGSCSIGEAFKQKHHNSPLIHPSTSPILSLTLLHNSGVAHHRPSYGSPLTPPTAIYERTTNNTRSGFIAGQSHGNNSNTHSQQQSASFRTNHFDMPDVAKYRTDYNEIKQAIAELYCSCNRGISIGKLLLDRIASKVNKNTNNRNSNGDSKIQFEQIDWVKICPLIDFRRFTSFGIVYGLLNRVHCYPLLVSDEGDRTVSSNDASPKSMAAAGSRRTDSALNRANSLGPSKIVGNPSTSSAMSVSRLFSLRAAHYLRNTNRGVSMIGGQNYTNSSLINTSSSTTMNNDNFQYRQRVTKEERRALAARVGERMDGMHCDDELVCAFQLPLLQLFDLVCDNGNQSIHKNTNSNSNSGSNNNYNYTTTTTTSNNTTKRIVSVYATES
jgi:Nitrogen permease regulator 2